MFILLLAPRSCVNCRFLIAWNYFICWVPSVHIYSTTKYFQDWSVWGSNFEHVNWCGIKLSLLIHCYPFLLCTINLVTRDVCKSSSFAYFIFFISAYRIACHAFTNYMVMWMDCFSRCNARALFPSNINSYKLQQYNITLNMNPMV